VWLLMTPYHARTHGRLTRAFCLAALGLAACFNLGLAALLVGRPDETRYGEAILYDHAARLVRGEALYQRLDGPPYTVASYTPLYYGVAAGLQLMVGPGFLPGRLVSLGAGLAVAGMLGWLVWRRTRTAWPALTAASLFVALGVVGPVPWTAAYKEDLLGIALGIASALVLEGATRRRTIAAAAVLAAAAILTKQSFLGPAVAGTVWLLATRPRSAALLFAGVLLGVILAAALVLEVTSGAFVANTVGGNGHQPFDLLTFEHNLREFATYQGVPLLLALPWLVRVRIRREFLALTWLAWLISMLPLGAVGADANYWIGFAAVTAVLASLTVWRGRTSWPASVGAALLGCAALVSVGSVGAWLLARPGYLGIGQPLDATVRGLADRVARTQGTVLADPLDVLVLAGRPVLIEPILFSLMEQDGTWDSRALVARICNGDVRLLVLGYPLEEVQRRWPLSVAAALRQTFLLEESVPLAAGRRYVLRRARESPGCG
jgi:hypothetical protein